MFHIPDVLTPDEVRQCREALERANWLDGRGTAGHMAVRAKDNQQLAQDDPLAQQIGDFIVQRLGNHPQFIAAALPLKVLPPRFNRYSGGGTYGEHIDNAIFSVPGTTHRVRSDLSATLFFCEPDEYDGGELVIDDTYGSQRVKLPAGDAVIYPGTSVHGVNPVTRGHRVASFFWIESMVRSDEQRRLLFDFDMNLLRLRQQSGESDLAVALSGTYHNLLRMWATT